MKNRLKWYSYIFSYIVVIAIPMSLAAITHYQNLDISLRILLNPFIFIIYDTILLYLIMKLLKKEEYVIQKKTLAYYKIWNNGILFLGIILATGSLMTALIDVLINAFMTIVLAPIPIDSEKVNGVEEFFNDHPERAKHKFYKNADEIKNEYAELRKEIETEIPVMEVKSKEQNGQKHNKVLAYVLVVVAILVITIGISFSLLENTVSFQRANYHYFQVELGDEKMNIYYEETYKRTIIPYLYVQESKDVFYSNKNEMTQANETVKNDRYVLKLKEYQCYNMDKGREVKTSCGRGIEVLNETPKEVKLVKSNMIIEYDDVVIYDGDFKEDITEYLNALGKYKFTITNKRDAIRTKITFDIKVVETDEK